MIFETIPDRNKTLSLLSGPNKTAWEKRSKLFGASLKGVLFKGVPDVVNEHLHDWHKKVILRSISGKGDLKILDVGCGYGRLSLPIIHKFPNLDIIGLDISETYVTLYKKNTNHPAWIGAIENIPEEIGTFDFILCVTVLMYLDPDQLNQGISNLLFHLKRGGKLILIEPHLSGHFFQTGFGLWTFLSRRVRKDTVDTQGRYFRSDEIEQLFKKAGGQVLFEWRLPITSLFFGPLTLAGKLFPGGVVKPFCKFISLLDGLLGRLKLPSIQVAYLIARDEKG
jgi:2-polyprenyl-3-methyl-5-hydroxy-6-metoxy-1,4-benzoquinol methylase